MNQEGTIYRVARVLCQSIFSTFAQTEVWGCDNIPEQGPFILASNHLSMVDPPILGCYLRRPLYYFARDTLFITVFTRWLLLKLHAIPVKRGRAFNIASIKQTLRVLREGYGVVIFPEGTRSPHGQLQTAKPGIGMIACRAKVPIIPVRLTGSDIMLRRGLHFNFRKSVINVVYGQPISPAVYDPGPNHPNRYQEAADCISAAIARLEEPRMPNL